MLRCEISNIRFGAAIASLFGMNADQFEGKWKQLKGSVKQRWAKLTDDDVTALSGKKDELIGKLQERYGITREQAQKEADEWAAAVNSETASADATAGARVKP